MSIDLDTVRVRIDNIKRKCTDLLAKDCNYYNLEDYEHLWTNFQRILELLYKHYPGAFDDIPKRTLRTVDIGNFGEEAIPVSAVELLNGDVEDCLNYLGLLKNDQRSLLMDSPAEDSIPEHVRRDICDVLKLGKSHWAGRLEDVEFLKRIYKLNEMPSTDHRFSDAEGDIWQHRVHNYDWSDDWIFDDERFELMRGPDSILLNFLCLTVHPAVREDVEEAEKLVQQYNLYLSTVGWQIIPQNTVAGRSIFTAVKSYSSMLKSQLDTMHQTLNTEYIMKLLNRMNASIETDPELAIGSAKELIESVCKTVLNDQNIPFDKDDNIQKLVKKALKELNLDPDDLPHTTKALDSIKPLLKSLGTIAQMMAELRGQFGTGHGKDAKSKGLGPRHAKLAVGAASALAVFLYETYLERSVTEKKAVGQTS